ncbi:MAG: b-glycosyltransferase, glycosyltransferase family 2 protein [Mucilaginibacter sp.]|nr:b-glycosyltransferase, glycosyltransferase family 2 protein [Mucilaginibacter sp.]
MISVIIPTCNRNDLLSKCLDCLKPEIQNIPSNEYEIIVTDDSKNNIAQKLIDEYYPWVIWVEGPKKGPAANRNNGAKIAKGEWLTFIDDDCLPNNKILYEYNKAINSFSDILAYEGRIYVDAPQTSFLQESPLNEYGERFWSCNICIKSSLFKVLGGFDQNFPFPAMEDVDFFKRLKQITDKYKFLYHAAVIHPWRKDSNLFKTNLKRYQSDLYFISKYPDEKVRMNYKFYFKAFVSFTKQTIKNSWKFRFSGFGKKTLCNFLQLYFGIRNLFNLDRLT